MDQVTVRGRPRSEEARQAVLDAALLLCARDGYAAVTMKGIADVAGVGRQTVYRWWPAKTDVLLEALHDVAEREIPGLKRSGDPIRDIRGLLRVTFRVLAERTGKAIAGLLADAQHDEELSKRLQGKLIGPRRETLRKIIEDGIDAGKLERNLSPELVVDLVFGTMWYRLLHHHAPVDDKLARDLADVVRRLL